MNKEKKKKKIMKVHLISITRDDFFNVFKIKIKIKINSGVAHSTQLEGRQPLRLRP